MFKLFSFSFLFLPLPSLPFHPSLPLPSLLLSFSFFFLSFPFLSLLFLFYQSGTSAMDGHCCPHPEWISLKTPNPEGCFLDDSKIINWQQSLILMSNIRISLEAITQFCILWSLYFPPLLYFLSLLCSGQVLVDSLSSMPCFC